MAANDSNEFIIPKKFLEQLEEFSNGGFILLTFSSKGNPVVHHSFETKKDQLALEATLYNYVEDLEDKKFDERHSQIMGDDEDEDEEESGLT